MPELEWSREVEQAQWWVTQLHPFAQDVGSVLPDCFDAYARIFHPIDVVSERRTWAEVAAANGRVAHADMQYHAISTPSGGRPDLAAIHSPLDGSLPREELGVLAELLAGCTTTPGRCWYAVWDGYGQLHGAQATLVNGGSEPADDHEPAVRYERPGPLVPGTVLDGPRISTPGRNYLLACGPLNDVVPLFDRIGGQSPNVWWPEDRAWIIASEIDFAWTYVAADRTTIDAVLAHPFLEARETWPDRRHTFDSDHVNGG